VTGTHALAVLAAADAVEGEDWRWFDTPVPPDLPYVADTPSMITVMAAPHRPPQPGRGPPW
jgi:hypothetical protein